MDRVNFYKKYGIHSSYYDFFNERQIKNIEKILETISSDEFSPKESDIFKVFKRDLFSRKVVLLGMDPYPQKSVATGRAFEVLEESWSSKKVNTSLKNMLKLIYKSYLGEIPTVAKLRQEIEKGSFIILPPNRLFTHWEDQGVLLLNTALTVKLGKAGSHIKIWKEFTRELLEYLGEKNPELIYFLWGGKAKEFEKYIVGEIIKHNHPAICGNLKNPNDFLNGESFIRTKEIINWLGLKEKKTKNLKLF